MEDRFCYIQSVPYYGVKPDYTLSFQCLMSLLQESSTAHTDHSPLPFTWYRDNKRGFLLTNWHVKIEPGAYPFVYDKIASYTWPNYFKGVSAERSFLAMDKNGSPFARAVARWGFADIGLRRLTRIPDVVSTAYGSCYPPVFKPDYTFPETTGYDKINEFPITARLCDTDSNYHVNNVKYIDWAINGVPEEMYYNMNVREMKTHYKKEVRPGDSLIMETYKKNNEIISLLKCLLKSGGEVSAGIYTLWG